jgi:hypothetical protein
MGPGDFSRTGAAQRTGCPIVAITGLHSNKIAVTDAIVKRVGGEATGTNDHGGVAKACGVDEECGVWIFRAAIE